MIDEKTLDVIEFNARHVLEANPSEQVGCGMCGMEVRQAIELIRLARLGLWAEDHGVPALRFYGDSDLYPTLMDRDNGLRARDALVLMPTGASVVPATEDLSQASRK